MKKSVFFSPGKRALILSQPRGKGEEERHVCNKQAARLFGDRLFDGKEKKEEEEGGGGG